MRRIYLDNLRWGTVLLVFIYHVFYLYNGVGILGGIPGGKSIPLFDALACIIYPWFMVLLFVIAGMSARYALENRTDRQFLRERVQKLVIPSTLGLFFVHWITGYLNIKMGGGLDFIPAALVYPISVLSGIGPLWFIQMLFCFSCALVLLRKADKADRLWKLGGKAGLPVILCLSLVVFAAAQVFNLPVFTMYRFGIYLVSFLIGYYLFSHETAQAAIERIRLPMGILSLIGAVCHGLRYGGSDYTSSACLQALGTNLYLWAVVLALLGYGRKYLNRETSFTRYMTRSSFGIYVLHYPVLLAVCYLLHRFFDLPAAWNYGIALSAGLLITFGVWEGIRRIPLIRYCVLGIRGEKTGRSKAP